MKIRGRMVMWVTVVTAWMLSIWSCSDLVTQKEVEQDQLTEMMANAPEYASYDCEINTSMLLSYGSWKLGGVKEITWAYDNWPLVSDSNKIIDQTRLAMAAWEEQMGIPIRMSKAVSKTNIIFRWAKYDGIGKKWGVSESPPLSPTDRMQIYITIDEYDYQARRADYDFYTGLLHEIGHGLGLLHSEDPSAVMYRDPKGIKKKLTIDDAAGMRLRYGRYGDFTLDGLRYVAIHRGGHRNLRRNWNEKEFWTTCNNYYENTHWIAAPIIDGFQIIREWADAAMKNTSNYRNATCNAIKSKATLSQHIYMRAGDFIFLENAWALRKAYEKDITTRGPLFQKLYAAGIRGFGSYNNGSFHIDCRPDNYCEYWYGKPLCSWGRLSMHMGTPIDEEITQD